jgi:hypothetical protein
MRNRNCELVSGVLIGNRQHYHHQYFLLIACTLVCLLLQLMLLLIEVHSQFSTIQGIPTYICSYPNLIYIIFRCDCSTNLLLSVLSAGHVHQILLFHWPNTENLFMELSSRLAWDLVWCLRPRNRVSAGNFQDAWYAELFWCEMCSPELTA